MQIVNGSRLRVRFGCRSRCRGTISLTRRVTTRGRREGINWVTEGDEGRTIISVPTPSLCIRITLCVHLSIRSGGGHNYSIRGRGLILGSFLTSGPSFIICSACVSGKTANAGFRHPNFRRVLSSVRTNRVSYIVIGSLSQLKHGSVSANCCVRRCFCSRGIHFVTIASRFSATSPNGLRNNVVLPLGGVVGRTCTLSVNQGVGTRTQRTVGSNSCVNKQTPCNCQGSPSGYRGLLISRATTPIIGRVFR